MRSPSSNYNTENAKLQKKTVVQVQLGSLANTYNSGTFSGIGGTDKKYLKSFSANLPSIDLLTKPFPKSGNYKFSIIDKDLDLTSDMNTNPLINDATVTVKYGFQGLAIGDFVTLETQKLSGSFKMKPDLQTYDFVSRDARRLLKGDIGRKSQSDRVINTFGQEYALNDITGFIDPTNLPNQFDLSTVTGKCAYAYTLINGDIASYESVNSGSDRLVSISQSIMGTETISVLDSIDNEIQQVYGFQNLYPTEALLYILHTTDDASGHAFYDLSKADVGYKGMGYETAIQTSDIDTEGIERLGWKFFNNGFENCHAISITEPTNGLEWIIKNILKPAGLYMFINQDGKISVKSLDRLDFIENFTSDDDLTKDDIVIVNSFEIDLDNFVNEIAFTWEIYDLKGEKEESWVFKNTDSVTTYGAREKPFVIESSLVTRAGDARNPQEIWRTDVNLEAQVRDVIVRRWMFTHGHNPMGILDFNVSPENWLLQPSDKIRITNDKIPDTDAGTRGWTTKEFFIIEQNMRPLATPPVFNYKALTWEAYTNLSAPYSFTTIASGDIDDTSITFSTDNTITTESEDGHWVEPLSIGQPDIFIMTVTILPPGNGSTHHWIKLGMKLIEVVTPAILFEHNYRAIRYLSSNSTAFDLDFVLTPIYDPSNANGIRTIKVDWWDASSDGLEGGGSERPTVTFKEIKYSNYAHALGTVKELL